MKAERVMLISVWDSLNTYRMKLANLSKTYGFEDVQGDCPVFFFSRCVLGVCMYDDLNEK